MMMWYRRLLAGLTSFMLKRCWSHRSAMGPSGALLSRGSLPGSASSQRVGASGRSMDIALPCLRCLFDEPEHDGERDDRVAQRDQQGQPEGQRPDPRVPPLA